MRWYGIVFYVGLHGFWPNSLSAQPSSPCQPKMTRLSCVPSNSGGSWRLSGGTISGCSDQCEATLAGTPCDPKVDKQAKDVACMPNCIPMQPEQKCLRRKYDEPDTCYLANANLSQKFVCNAEGAKPVGSACSKNLQLRCKSQYKIK